VDPNSKGDKSLTRPGQKMAINLTTTGQKMEMNRKPFQERRLIWLIFNI